MALGSAGFETWEFRYANDQGIDRSADLLASKLVEDSGGNAERRHSHLGFASPSGPSGLDYVQPVIILGAEHLRLCDDWGAISEEVCSRLAKDGQAALPIIWRSY